MGVDVNRDGHIGQPVRRLFTIREVREDRGTYHDREFDPPGDYDVFADVAYAALTEQSITEARWTGSDGPYSKSDWHKLRDKLIAWEWWAWVNPRAHTAGIRVTNKGKRQLAQWLEEYAADETDPSRMLIDA